MLGILYDMHGNLPALDAVLTDARERGADRFLLGGDYAAFGAWPLETVVRLQEELGGPGTWIRGNWERWQADPAAVPDDTVLQAAADDVRTALGDDVVTRLGTLAPAADWEGTLFCHASPASDMESFVPDGASTQDDARLLEGVTQRRVVFGHTHLQFQRTTDSGVELVNPGSVGMPLDGDVRAAYALLDGDRIELRRVEYDHEQSAAELEQLGVPWAVTTARRLREARFDA
jgi:predicted phosphodiesterase